MKVVGDKIRQARIIRGKGIKELADDIGVSKQAVFQYENDLAEPKNEVLFKLVASLGFPLRFFTIANATLFNVQNNFFRALLSANKLDKLSWSEQAKIVTSFYLFLSEYLEMPELNLPIIHDDLIETKNYDFIASAARAHWQLRDLPVKNIVNLLEENGVIISTIKSSKRIDAFTQTYEYANLFCIILEDIKNSMARRNFNLAHELGHILLHSYINFDELDKDKKLVLEKEADKFAAAFLLPTEAFNYDLKYPNSLNAYIELKQKWHVSILAMIMRAKDLGRITEEGYLSLIKKYNYKQYRTCEPLDDMIPRKKPNLFQQSLEILLNNNILSVESLLNELDKKGCALYLNELVNFLALDKDFFDRYVGKKVTVAIKPKEFNIESSNKFLYAARKDNNVELTNADKKAIFDVINEDDD